MTVMGPPVVTPLPSAGATTAVEGAEVAAVIGDVPATETDWPGRAGYGRPSSAGTADAVILQGLSVRTGVHLKYPSPACAERRWSTGLAPSFLHVAGFSPAATSAWMTQASDAVFAALEPP